MPDGIFPKLCEPHLCDYPKPEALGCQRSKLGLQSAYAKDIHNKGLITLKARDVKICASRSTKLSDQIQRARQRIALLTHLQAH